MGINNEKRPKLIALRRVIWLHRRVSLFGKIKKHSLQIHPRHRNQKSS
ncbi:hypothetical protein CSC12_5835 [Klebsiella michiganensis]|nr:hypothetical protein CSC12_5835 [Klebsiella michiganensis]